MDRTYNKFPHLTKYKKLRLLDDDIDKVSIPYFRKYSSRILFEQTIRVKILHDREIIGGNKVVHLGEEN